MHTKGFAQFLTLVFYLLLLHPIIIEIARRVSQERSSEPYKMTTWESKECIHTPLLREVAGIRAASRGWDEFAIWEL